MPSEHRLRVQGAILAARRGRYPRGIILLIDNIIKMTLVPNLLVTMQTGSGNATRTLKHLSIAEILSAAIIAHYQ